MSKTPTDKAFENSKQVLTSNKQGKNMKQSKKQSAIESVTNIVVGLFTSFLIQIWLYPLLNIPVSISQNIIITLVFFVASFVRGYLIRRFFNNKINP